jgi:hypothetical protein
LQQLRIEKQNQLLVSNSLFGQNQKELEKMRVGVKEEEEEKDHQEDNKKKVSREFSQIIQAIKNLFNRCQATMRNKVKTVGSNNSGNREQWDYNLEIIHSRIKDLLEIEDEYNLSLKQIDNGLAGMNMSTASDLKENSSISGQMNNVSKPPV